MYIGKQIYMLMSVGTPRGKKKIVDPLELELQEL